MSEAGIRLERRWEWFLRRGYYALVALAAVLGVIASGPLGVADRLPELLAGLAGLVAWHWFCVDRRWSVVFAHPGGTLSTVYALVRGIAVFVLGWINPFLAIVALAGYYDAKPFAGRRFAPVVYLVSAITLAGSQAGGFPLGGEFQLLAFAGLIVLHLLLIMFFSSVEHHEAVFATEREETIAALEEANAKLERALDDNASLEAELWERARAEGVRDERERVALELHDTVAQGLAGIVTQLQAAADVPVDRAVAEHLQRAEELARSSLQEARRVVVAMGPDGLDGSSLPSVLTERVRSWSEQHAIDAEVVVTGDPLALGPDREVVVLRIVLEALANTARHAGASRATVTLSYTDGGSMVDIRDDGAGFDPRATVTDEISGFGIAGMRRRAERAGGDLLVESEVGGGTAISLRLPSAHDD